RIEGDLGAGQQTALVLAHRRIADDGQRPHGVAALEAHAVLLAVAIDDQLQPVRQGVDHRDADAVQAAGHLVGVLVELAAGVQLGEDQLDARHALFGVDVHGHAATVVGHGDRTVLVQGDGDQCCMAGEGFVDGVVDHLEDHVVQAGAVIRIADIHARALTNCVQTFQHTNGIRAIFGRGSSLFGHENVGSGSAGGRGRGGGSTACLRGANQRVPKSPIYRKLDGKSHSFPSPLAGEGGRRRRSDEGCLREV
uniref:Phenol hydroxylase n=1 Tax=Parastrongyloides trichosuri TaxID=131310 RepID=A0A0N4ZJK4_PARTI